MEMQTTECNFTVNNRVEVNEKKQSSRDGSSVSAPFVNPAISWFFKSTPTEQKIL
jgi:hypothetical protein